MNELKLRVARMQSLLEQIARERARQDAKWGWPRDHGMLKWSAILQEEVGEVAQAVLQCESHDKPGDWPAELKKELIQVAAVCWAMLQQIAEAEACKHLGWDRFSDGRKICRLCGEEVSSE